MRFIINYFYYQIIIKYNNMQDSVTSMMTYSVRELLENEEDIKNNLLVCPICS